MRVVSLEHASEVQLCWLYRQQTEAVAMRLSVIERLMCGPLEPEERKALRREYLDLTEPEYELREQPEERNAA